jgi:hypothetical protein
MTLAPAVAASLMIFSAFACVQELRLSFAGLLIGRCVSLADTVTAADSKALDDQHTPSFSLGRV